MHMESGQADAKLMGAIKISLAVGILMLVMKVYAFIITGSAAIFSDAAESVVHNFAVVFALFSMWLSSKPADRSHPYGHDKISYFSAGFEGMLIVCAAFVIIYAAVMKWIHGLQLENLGTGIFFTAAAAVINAVLGLFLIWRGKKYHSIILEANGHHVLTDSWTSLGVIIGLALAKYTGWLPFDPICAILVATNILWAGFSLMRRSIGGLMDEADPKTDENLRAILDRETKEHGIAYHELRHRNAGRITWVELHLLFSDETHIKTAHRVATEIEEVVEQEMKSETHVTTHLEPKVDHQKVHQSES
ncbi:MAG: cation diffusion facilitator family transporter [bacterium]